MTDKAEGARLSVKLNSKATDQLRDLTDRRGITLTNAVLRAIDLLYFVEMLEPNEVAQVEKDARGEPYVKVSTKPADVAAASALVPRDVVYGANGEPALT